MNSLKLFLLVIVVASGWICLGQCGCSEAAAEELSGNAIKDTPAVKVKLPKLLDLGAKKCIPCKMMAPHFESAASLLEPNVRLVKINTETEQALAARYTIQSIPTLILFFHGKEIARSSGAMGAQDMVRWVNQHLG